MEKRRGFTLIELLIVLLVLGILSGVTIFSTLDVASSADANKVINDLMQVRTAMLMWFKENSWRVRYDSSSNLCKIKTNGTELPFNDFIKNYGSEIRKYLSNNDTIVFRTNNEENNTGDFTFLDINTNKTRKWYICCNLGAPDLLKKGEEAPDAKVREKVAAKAKKLRLLGLAEKNDTPNDTNYYTAEKRFVCTLVLELNK